MPDQAKYGICHLSLIPVRSEPSDKSELCTQLLFGDAYQVLNIADNRKWFYIRTLDDDYPGWIDHLQYFQITDSFYLKLQNAPKYINLDILTYLHHTDYTFPITLGSSLPFFTAGKTDLESLHFEVKGKNFISHALDYEQLDYVVSKYLHAPYLWGGKSIWGIDCSGFTQMTYKLLGSSLPRDAYQQAVPGKHIPTLEQTQAGDLAFFEREGRIVHVGIILDQLPPQPWKPTLKLNADEKLIVHALDTVRVDKLDHQGIYNLDRQIYTHSLSLLRRVFKGD